MSDDLVKRLRDGVVCVDSDAAGVSGVISEFKTDALCYEAADMIEELEAKLAKAVEALVRIAHASDIYSVEANAEDQGADTLAYAHKSICNLARTTLAELEGQDDE